MAWKVNYTYPEQLRAKLEERLVDSDYFIRDASAGHEDGIILSLIDKPRTRCAELYYCAKGLTIYPANDYLSIADQCFAKAPAYHENYGKKYEYFVTEDELIHFMDMIKRGIQ